MGFWGRIHGRAAERASYALLLAVLVVAMLVAPVLHETGSAPSWVLSLAALFVLLGCLGAAIDRTGWYAAVVLLVIGIEVLFGLAAPRAGVAAASARHVARLAVHVLFAVILLRDIVRSRRVTASTILGAICVYLLLGFAWGEAYIVTDRLWPGSFAGLGGGIAADPVGGELTARYFSFVTMTTLGYGDLAPARAVARSLAVLQAMTGQLYIAIIVARLVGLTMSTTASPEA